MTSYTRSILRICASLDIEVYLKVKKKGLQQCKDGPKVYRCKAEEIQEVIFMSKSNHVTEAGLKIKGQRWMNWISHETSQCDSNHIQLAATQFASPFLSQRATWVLFLLFRTVIIWVTFPRSKAHESDLLWRKCANDLVEKIVLVEKWYSINGIWVPGGPIAQPRDIKTRYYKILRQ